MTLVLPALLDWLCEREVTHVAPESTRIYRKPVRNFLEGHLEVLANEQRTKAVPCQSMDPKGCEWIDDLPQHGLLRRSFIPPEPNHNLRV